MHSLEKSQMSRFHLKPNWSCCDFFFFTRLKKKIVELISLNALHLRYISTKQKHKNKQTNNCAITKPHVTSLFLSLCHLSWCSGLPFLVCASVGFQSFPEWQPSPDFHQLISHAVFKDQFKPRYAP